MKKRAKTEQPPHPTLHEFKPPHPTLHEFEPPREFPGWTFDPEAAFMVFPKGLYGDQQAPAPSSLDAIFGPKAPKATTAPKTRATVCPGYLRPASLPADDDEAGWAAMCRPVTVVDYPEAHARVDCLGRASAREVLQGDLLPALDSLPCSYAFAVTEGPTTTATRGSNARGEVRVSAMVHRCRRVVAVVRVYAVPQQPGAAGGAAATLFTLGYFRRTGEQEASLHFFTQLEDAIIDTRRRQRAAAAAATAAAAAAAADADAGGGASAGTSAAVVVDDHGGDDDDDDYYPLRLEGFRASALPAPWVPAAAAAAGPRTADVRAPPETYIHNLESPFYGDDAAEAACCIVEWGLSCSGAAGNVHLFSRLAAVLAHHNPNCSRSSGSGAGGGVGGGDDDVRRAMLEFNPPRRDVFVSVAVAMADGLAAAGALGLLPKKEAASTTTTTTTAAAGLFGAEVLHTAATELVPAMLAYVEGFEEDVEGSREILAGLGRVLKALLAAGMCVLPLLPGHTRGGDGARRPLRQDFASRARDVLSGLIRTDVDGARAWGDGGGGDGAAVTYCPFLRTTVEDVLGDLGAGDDAGPGVAAP